MKTTATRCLDGQGRVILPSYMRKALNLAKDSGVTIELIDGGRIVITAAEPRCAICGAVIRGYHKDAQGKKVCLACIKALTEQETRRRTCND